MKNLLMLCGLPEKAAEEVVSSKLAPEIIDKIKNIHKYNVVIMINKFTPEDKLFLLGKIMQLYLKNNIKAIIVPFLSLEKYLNMDYSNITHAKIVIVDDISGISREQLQMLRVLPFIYKDKTFVLVFDDEEDYVCSKLYKSYLLLKVTTLEVA